MWKLVRDKIQDMSIEAGDDRQFGKTYNEAHIEYLKLKVIEEAQEVIEATSKEHLTEEIGDLYEVLQELLRQSDIPLVDVVRAKQAKKKKKGGFTKGIILNMGS